MATNSTTKKPQDRKPTKAEVSEEKQRDFSEIEGSDLLVPFSKVKGSDQARLVNRLKSLGLFSDDTDSEGGDDVSFQDLDLEAVADLIDYVSEKFSKDSGKFDDFTRGSGGMERAVNLAVGFAGELGKESD